MTSQSFINKLPCSGFIKKSANICYMGQCFTLIFSDSNLFFIQKYLMLMCLDFDPQEFLPFVSK